MYHINDTYTGFIHKKHLFVFLLLPSNMGPKQVFMMLNTLAVGAAGGAAGGAKKKQSTGSGGPAGGGAKKQKGPAGGAVEGVDEELINGYPTAETIQTLTLEFLETEKAKYKAKGSKLAIPILEKDKRAMYGSLGRRCQEFCESKLNKQKGELDLSREYMEILLEQYHSGDMQYYKDKDGKEYKDLSKAPCWFCRVVCDKMFKQFSCDHEKKGPGYNIPCDKICCTKCSPQGEHFNAETDEFFCCDHNNDEAKKQHEETMKKRKVVDPLLSVYALFHQPKETVKLSVFRTIGGDRNLTQKYMRNLFGLKKSEVPSEAMYEIAATATGEAGAVPKITVLSKQDVKAPPEPRIELNFLPEYNKHFWYTDFHGIITNRKKFSKLLTDKKIELEDDMETFRTLEKKAKKNEEKRQEIAEKGGNMETFRKLEKKAEKYVLELDKKRQEIAEEVDMVTDIMRIGKNIIPQNEWKSTTDILADYWKEIGQLTIRAPVRYDEEVPDEEMQVFPMAEEDLLV